MSSTLVEQIHDAYMLYAQAAQHIGVTKRTLGKWVKAGRVPVYHIGREVLIEKRLVEELKAKR